MRRHCFRICVLTALPTCLWLATVTVAGAETVRFDTEDGVRIVGELSFPEPGVLTVIERRPLVILLHMYASDRSAWKPLVPKLTEAGFAVLAIDMRGHGESVEPASQDLARRVKERDASLFNAMPRDVAAACAFLADRLDVDASRFAIVGASVGCSVAIEYAAHDASVDAIVCLSPGTDYLGVDSTRPVKALGKRAMLLLATEGERKAPDELARLNPNVTTDIVGKGTVHGTRMFGRIEGIEDRIVEFITAAVGKAADKSVYTAYPDGKKYYATVEALTAAERVDRTRVRVLSSAQEAKERGLTEGE